MATSRHKAVPRRQAWDLSEKVHGHHVRSDQQSSYESTPRVGDVTCVPLVRAHQISRVLPHILKDDLNRVPTSHGGQHHPSASGLWKRTLSQKCVHGRLHSLYQRYVRHLPNEFLRFVIVGKQFVNLHKATGSISGSVQILCHQIVCQHENHHCTIAS